jgi:hypothetical protein
VQTNFNFHPRPLNSLLAILKNILGLEDGQDGEEARSASFCMLKRVKKAGVRTRG